MILSSVKHSDVQCREPLVRNLPPSLLVSVLALVLVLVYGRVVRALIHGVYDTEHVKHRVYSVASPLSDTFLLPCAPVPASFSLSSGSCGQSVRPTTSV
jgi:hypothetical protein